MKTYCFVANIIVNGKVVQRSHNEKHECDADAMERARNILKEIKHDKVSVMQVDVFELKHIVSYQ